MALRSPLPTAAWRCVAGTCLMVVFVLVSAMDAPELIALNKKYDSGALQQDVTLAILKSIYKANKERDLGKDALAAIPTLPPFISHPRYHEDAQNALYWARLEGKPCAHFRAAFMAIREQLYTAGFDGAQQIENNLAAIAEAEDAALCPCLLFDPATTVPEARRLAICEAVVNEAATIPFLEPQVEGEDASAGPSQSSGVASQASLGSQDDDDDTPLAEGTPAIKRKGFPALKIVPVESRLGEPPADKDWQDMILRWKKELKDTHDSRYKLPDSYYLLEQLNEEQLAKAQPERTDITFREHMMMTVTTLSHVHRKLKGNKTPLPAPLQKAWDLLCKALGSGQAGSVWWLFTHNWFSNKLQDADDQNPFGPIIIPPAAVSKESYTIGVQMAWPWAAPGLEKTCAGMWVGSWIGIQYHLGQAVDNIMEMLELMEGLKVEFDKPAPVKLTVENAGPQLQTLLKSMAKNIQDAASALGAISFRPGAHSYIASCSPRFWFKSTRPFDFKQLVDGRDNFVNADHRVEWMKGANGMQVFALWIMDVFFTGPTRLMVENAQEHPFGPSMMLIDWLQNRANFAPHHRRWLFALESYMDKFLDAWPTRAKADKLSFMHAIVHAYVAVCKKADVAAPVHEAVAKEMFKAFHSLMGFRTAHTHRAHKWLQVLHKSDKSCFGEQKASGTTGASKERSMSMELPRFLSLTTGTKDGQPTASNYKEPIKALNDRLFGFAEIFQSSMYVRQHEQLYFAGIIDNTDLAANVRHEAYRAATNFKGDQYHPYMASKTHNLRILFAHKGLIGVPELSYTSSIGDEADHDAKIVSNVVAPGNVKEEDLKNECFENPQLLCVKVCDWVYNIYEYLMVNGHPQFDIDYLNVKLANKEIMDITADFFPRHSKLAVAKLKSFPLVAKYDAEAGPSDVGRACKKGGDDMKARADVGFGAFEFETRPTATGEMRVVAPVPEKIKPGDHLIVTSNPLSPTEDGIAPVIDALGIRPELVKETRKLLKLADQASDPLAKVSSEFHNLITKTEGGFASYVDAFHTKANGQFAQDGEPSDLTVAAIGKSLRVADPEILDLLYTNLKDYTCEMNEAQLAEWYAENKEELDQGEFGVLAGKAPPSTHTMLAKQAIMRLGALLGPGTEDSPNSVELAQFFKPFGPRLDNGNRLETDWDEVFRFAPDDLLKALPTAHKSFSIAQIGAGGDYVSASVEPIDYHPWNFWNGVAGSDEDESKGTFTDFIAQSCPATRDVDTKEVTGVPGSEQCKFHITFCPSLFNRVDHSQAPLIMLAQSTGSGAFQGIWEDRADSELDTILYVVTRASKPVVLSQDTVRFTVEKGGLPAGTLYSATPASDNSKAILKVFGGRENFAAAIAPTNADFVATFNRIVLGQPAPYIFLCGSSEWVAVQMAALSTIPPTGDDPLAIKKALLQLTKDRRIIHESFSG